MMISLTGRMIKIVHSTAHDDCCHPRRSSNLLLILLQTTPQHSKRRNISSCRHPPTTTRCDHPTCLQLAGWGADHARSPAQVLECL
jgi:hypothetical protein